MANINLEIDTDYGLAYLQLTDGEIEKTVEFSSAINVDLDSLGVVVGIEILSLPGLAANRDSLDRLINHYHVDSRVKGLAESALSLLVTTGASKAISVSHAPSYSPELTTSAITA